MINYEDYKFEPGAMSIIQMGEELIGHPSTALNELVKNAYDADASKCWVYTQYDKNKERTFLLIKDNGLGMDKDILFGDWLKPSISSKRDEKGFVKRSEIFERLFLGSKGIGRLAVMALGQHITVISKKYADKKYNWLRLDREVFRDDKSLDMISFPGGQIDDYINLFKDEDILSLNSLNKNGNLINIISNDLFGNFQEGTLIVVQNIDDSVKTIIENEFEQTQIEEIEVEETSFFKSLRDLITPLKLNAELQDELINRKIINKELKIDNGESTFDLFYGLNFIKEQVKSDSDFLPVEPSSILQHYDYRVFGKVLSDASVNGRYICRRIKEDPRDKVLSISSSYNLTDGNIKTRKIPDIDIDDKYKNPEVGEFYFDIRIYDLDGDAKDNMADVLKANGRREATRIFSKYLGLKVSKNGFGVKPYGEEDKDWLGLGAKRVQKHIETIGPNQIIGNIFLYSPQNDALNEKTNREGFFENRAFIIFKKILDGILEETGKTRAKYREFHNLGRSIKSKHQRPDTEKFIQYIIGATDNEDVIRKSQKFIEEANTAFDNMENSLSFSQRLASLGTGLELVYHEISQPISSIGASKSSLEILINKLNDESIKERLKERLSTVGASLEALSLLQKSLRPAIGRSIAKTFKPIETFNKVCYLFKDIFDEKGIIIEISGNLKDFEIRDFEYVLWITFLNIINNAVYWLTYAEQKRIIILEYSNDNLVISNTGPFIPEEDLETIFSYGITGRKEKNATGLGLAFTRNLLELRDWNIWAENRKYGPSFYIKKSKE